MKSDYFEFLRFPSISADPERSGDVRRCGDWVADYLKKGGFDVDLWETSGYPTIFAQNEQREGRPTLLFYGHYDVQPADPLELWDSDPFEPTEKKGEVYARGAQDNKGQIFYTMAALIDVIDEPINIKLCIEGEEESGSTGLSGILQERSEQLQADAILVVDIGIPAKDQPAITLGTRGMLTMSILCRGSAFDLHSGAHGGVVYNPNHAIVAMLASLRNDEGKVLVDGFYDGIEVSTEGIDLLFDEPGYKRDFGAEPIGGEQEFSPAESLAVRPTLEINGVAGGYAGPGFKTVIPAVAHAKISCRLVPGQDPDKIAHAIERHLKAACPKGLELDVEIHSATPASRSKATSPIAKAAKEAYEELFNKPCQQILSGASIPIASELQQAAGGDILFIGLGLDSDRIHSPNEHFGLDRIETGFKLIRSIIKRTK